MFGGRGRLPVLAEVSGSVAADRPWALSRHDFEALSKVRERVDGRRVLLVTGVDGAARTLAVCLAALASASGRRTVLVDCDLERSALAGELGLAPAPGVHEYLRWEATPAQILQPLALAGPASATASEPLVFVAAGRPAADPATLLGLQSFRHMSAKLRNAYELVVVAGPPPGSGGGALTTLAAEADAVLAGIEPSQAERRPRRALGSALRRLGPAPLGAVVVQRS